MSQKVTFDFSKGTILKRREQKVDIRERNKAHQSLKNLVAVGSSPLSSASHPPQPKDQILEKARTTR